MTYRFTKTQNHYGMKFLPLFIISLVISSCYAPIDYSKPSYARKSGGPEPGMPSKPGACYAKCLIPDKMETHYDELIVYTGDPNDNNAAIETINYETNPASTKWVKKKTDINCLSDNPDDCLVWCMVEVPAQYRRVTIVTDTSMTKDFEIKQMESLKVSQQGGFTEWREVVCNGKLTSKLIREIQLALSARGFYQGEITGKMESNVNKALTAFQKENALPIGQLDFESLDALGITGL